MNNSKMPKQFRISLNPIANPEAVVTGPGFRFTILTSQMIRMEHDPTNTFEDRASQVFWFRNQPVPEFRVRRQRSSVEIETEKLHLTYEFGGGGFSKDTLRVKLTETGLCWHYGDSDEGNLLGTARTLDGVDGATALEPGLLSRSGWAVIDDSGTLVFTDGYWLDRRLPAGDPLSSAKKDLYFFGYGHEYTKCLQDFCRVAGRTPLLPRWALGNWWSRYWAYTQEELQNLVQEFADRDIPLGVCIIDMDWHVVENPYTNGWTGYTWNRELFPNPKAFVSWLHERGLRTALNLHPADGVHPHEEQYEKMAKYMGLDPKKGNPVPFDIADPEFIRAYFEILHHPMERDLGIDFWWIDWQQGTRTQMEGLDPLWALNHLHCLDRSRDRDKRPFTFSRWAGLGGHRYPIGFSGDTIVSWDSLAFQPYFTSTAANVAFGWWSHDIGGHMLGQEDPELYTRWVQFGVFNPIMRLHSTKDPYMDRRPWGNGGEAYKATSEAMRFRHRLIPYLYTMSWRDHTEAIPLVTPMYHLYPEREGAYCCPNQYWFGSELIVSPHVLPKDRDTGLSRQVVWLPEGDWFDFWSGEHYKGDSWHAKYGVLEDIPVFARRGAIVPLGPAGGAASGNPEFLEVVVFPGADNTFDLYEDDGESMAYEKGQYAMTRFSQKWGADHLEFTIHPVKGDKNQVPARRSYQLRFRGIAEPSSVAVKVSGDFREVKKIYDSETETLTIEFGGIAPWEEVNVLLSRTGDLMGKRDRTLEGCRKMLRAFRMKTKPKEFIEKAIAKHVDGRDLSFLLEFASVLHTAQTKALVEVLAGVGVEKISQQQGDNIIMWNNAEREDVFYTLSAWKDWDNHFSEKVRVSRFRVVRLNDWAQSAWRLEFSYPGPVSQVFCNERGQR